MNVRLKVLAQILSICVIAAVGLALLNATVGNISSGNDSTITLGRMQAAVPEGSEFSQPRTVGGVRTVVAHDSAGRIAGYYAQSSAQGSSGDIELAIGFLPNGSVRSISVISQHEMPGITDEVFSDKFLERFIGQREPTRLGDDIDAITGATRSCEGVTEAVNKAVSAISTIIQGGE